MRSLARRVLFVVRVGKMPFRAGVGSDILTLSKKAQVDSQYAPTRRSQFSIKGISPEWGRFQTHESGVTRQVTG